MSIAIDIWQLNDIIAVVYHTANYVFNSDSLGQKLSCQI